MAPTPIKSAVLGVGLGGLTFHIPFILALPELFTLHAVLERNPTSPGGKVAARFGSQAVEGVTIYTDYDELLMDGEIELILISTPSDTHYELAKRALEAGKHVLVDKPVTARAEEAYELGALAKAKGLVLYPFQNCRYHSDFFALRKLLALPESDPRSLGTLVEFETHYDRYRTKLKGTWKDEMRPANGLVYDLGAHLIDQVLLLFGRPEKLSATIRNLRGIGHADVADDFTIVMHYPPRAAPAGTLQPTAFTAIVRGHSLSVRARQLRWVVRGLFGTFVKYGVDPQEGQIKAMQSASEILTDPTFGYEDESSWGTLEHLAEGDAVVTYPWPSERGEYAGLFRDIAATIREGKPQAIKWEESAEVIEMIELAYLASKEERTLVVPPRPS